jgi:hypothetical protein
MQSNNDEVRNEILFDERQQCFDKDLFSDENKNRKQYYFRFL